MGESKKAGRLFTRSGAPHGPRPLVLFAVTRADRAADVEVAARAAVGAGFDGIEWPISAQMPDSVLSEIGGKSADAARKEMEKGGILAVSIPFSIVDGSMDQPLLVDLLEWARRCGVLVLRLMVDGLPMSGGDHAQARPDADMENRLFHVLTANRFAAEASGVDIAVDTSMVHEGLGTSTLRDLIDAVGSSAIGACAVSTTNACDRSLTVQASLLGYRIKMIGMYASALTDADVHDEQGERQCATFLCDALGHITKRATLVLHGDGDPAGAFGMVSKLLKPFA